MSTQYSEQLNSVNASGTYRTGYSNPAHSHGRVRIGAWDFNTTDDIDAALAEGDVIRLVKIPPHATIFGGKALFEAMGTDQIAKLGLIAVDGSGYLDKAETVADNDKFFTESETNDGIDVSSAGASDFGLTLTDGYRYKTEKECWLVATLDDTSSADPWAADKDFNGHLFYVVD